MFQTLLAFVERTKLQVTAPVFGGGVGWIYAEKLAPVVSIIVALIGLIFGAIGLIMKYKEHVLKMKQLRADESNSVDK